MTNKDPIKSVYSERQPVYIVDPSRRLEPTGSYASATQYAGRDKFLVDKVGFNFPFTPSITVISTVNHASYDMTHTNFQQKAFDMGTNAELSLTAPITINSEDEAIAVVRGASFFRSAMKMTFGKNETDPGLPPPVLRLNAYGLYQNVPILLRDFTWNLENNVDYIETEVEGVEMRLPKSSTFVMSLSTTYGTKDVREKFTLDNYASGKLRSEGYI